MRKCFQHQLQNTRQSHQHLLQRIPDIDDLQASWLLLLFCASPRCNHILRTTAPALAADFAADHDVAVAGCLQQLLGGPDLPATAPATAHVPLAQGGLGLQSATATAPAAYYILGVLGRHPAHLSPAIASIHSTCLRVFLQSHSLVRRPVISVPLVSNLAPQAPPPPASPH